MQNHTLLIILLVASLIMIVSEYWRTTHLQSSISINTSFLSTDLSINNNYGFIAIAKKDNKYFGRFSNIYLTFMHAIRIAVLTQKKYVFLPIDYHWFQILDLNTWNRMLDSTDDNCTINGIPISTIISLDDNTIIHYLETSIEKWSTGCSIRPIHHLFSLYSYAHTNVTQIGHVDVIFNNHRFNKVIPLPPQSIKDRGDILQIEKDNADILLTIRSTQGIIASVTSAYFAFSACLLSSDNAYIAPYSSQVTRHAKTFYNHVMSNATYNTLLCVHVRLEDLATRNAPWVQYKPHVQEFLRRQKQSYHTGVRVPQVLIITNGNSNETAEMQRDFPQATIGCSGVLPECSGDVNLVDTMYSAIEQETCSMADEFIGSALSSFTYVIAAKRAHIGVFPGTRADFNGKLYNITDHECNWEPSFG